MSHVRIRPIGSPRDAIADDRSTIIKTIADFMLMTMSRNTCTSGF